MSDYQHSEFDKYDSDGEPMRLGWELPEIIAIAILLAFSVLAVGGLLAGILEANNLNQPGLPNGQTVGPAIQTGSGWAEPLLGIALLAVIALLWWTSQTWTGSQHDDEPLADDLETWPRIIRWIRITRWTQGGLLLTAAGGIASFVGDILLFSGQGHASQYYVVSGSSCLAILVIAGAGLFCSWKFVGQFRSFRNR
jgi:hypothetical protein